MKELKPCPFCGGEGEVNAAYWDCHGEKYESGCANPQCLVHPYSDLYDTEEEAIEAWNTRYERTCTNLANEYKHGNFRCSECGFHEWTCDECYSHPEDWSYCPQCGAKVVE